MRKVIAIILVLVLALGLVSCGKQEDSANTQTVIFYKDGMKTEVKDNDLYLEIVDVIEPTYKAVALNSFLMNLKFNNNCCSG